MTYHPEYESTKEKLRKSEKDLEDYKGWYMGQFIENQKLKRLLNIRVYKFNKLMRGYNKLLRGVNGTLPYKGVIKI